MKFLRGIIFRLISGFAVVAAGFAQTGLDSSVVYPYGDSVLGEEFQQGNSISLGDIDGDGDLDVIAGNSGNNSYGRHNRLYLNNGTRDPFFQVRGTIISNDEDRTEDTALGDLDNDGDLDLVVANLGGTEKYYLNNGTDTPFLPVESHPFDLNITAWSVALGDVDNDGDLDALFGYSDDAAYLYFNQGPELIFSGSAPVPVLEFPFNTRNYVGMADLNNDGWLDIVVAIEQNRSRAIMNNRSSNPFADAQSFELPGTPDFVSDLAIADVNNDGFLDIIISSYTPEFSILYLNNGTDFPFEGAVGSRLIDEASRIRTLGLADINNDGLEDLVTGAFQSANRYYLNNGTDKPFQNAAGIVVFNDGGYSNAIGLGDLDQNGTVDLVTGTDDSYQNRYFLNRDASKPFQQKGIQILEEQGTPLEFLQLFDLNRDGLLDLIATRNRTEGYYSINDGTETPFQNGFTIQFPTEPEVIRDIVSADLNQDGFSDIVFADQYGSDYMLLNNQTDVPFSNVSPVAVGNRNGQTIALELGDLDQDGDIDFITANRDNDVVSGKIFLNEGGERLFNNAEGIEYNTVVRSFTDLKLEDLNNDGYPDAVAITDRGSPRVYWNTKTIPFFTESNFTNLPSQRILRSLALSDLNGDGLLDVVLAGEQNSIAINIGSSNSFEGVDLHSDVHDNASRVVVDDFNQDGFPDIIIGTTRREQNFIFLNPGTGKSFDEVDPIYVTPARDDAISMTAGDIDGDGFSDLVVGHDIHPNAQIFWNKPPEVEISPDMFPERNINPTDLNLIADITESQAEIGRIEYFSDGEFIGYGNLNSTEFIWSSIPTGEHHITARVTSILGRYIVSDPVVIEVLDPLEIAEMESLVFDPQTGLFIQQITIQNIKDIKFEAFRVWIEDVPEEVQVFNAHGTENGRYYVDFRYSIDPSERIVLPVEYYASGRLLSDVANYFVEPINKLSVEELSGDTVEINRILFLETGENLVEFSSIPERTYAIQFSSDMQNWETALPHIHASQNRTQWIDSGGTKTGGLPAGENQRFYRILLIPEP